MTSASLFSASADPAEQSHASSTARKARMNGSSLHAEDRTLRLSQASAAASHRMGGAGM